MIHLTGFMIYCPAPHTPLSWVYPPEKIRSHWYEMSYWDEIARTLEEGKFDAFFFADAWGAGRDAHIRYALQFPAQDPVVLVPRLAALTRHLGFAVTMSTTFYPPFMLARKLSTLDHVTEGRIGWNIVTSLNRGEARNFGMDEMPPHDERYDRADEYLDLVNQLWESWEPDAMKMDMETKTFADPEKIHRINFEGKWYRCAGPLTVAPSPQGKPVLFQAGASARGREFAARWSECVFGAGNGPQEMREFCDDVRARADRAGRDPRKLKFVWTAGPIVARTEAEARERQAEIVDRIPVEAGIATMSGHFNLDLSTFPLETKMSELPTVQGTQGMLERYRAGGNDPTLREVAGRYLNMASDSRMVGTASQIADVMQGMIEEGDGNGFQVTPQYYAPDYYRDIVDMLVPELQKRGLIRKEYNGRTLRDNLDQETPE